MAEIKILEPTTQLNKIKQHILYQQCGCDLARCTLTELTYFTEDEDVISCGGARCHCYYMCFRSMERQVK